MIDSLAPPPDDPRLLGEAAMAETAAEASPATVETPGQLHRNVTPSKAFVTQEYCYGLLRTLVPEGGLEDWSGVANEVARIAQALVTDAASFEAFLRALFQALAEDLARIPGEISETALNVLQIQVYALGIAVATVMLAGGGFGFLLATDPDLRENLAQVMLGALEGASESGIASASSVSTMLAANVALAPMAPLTAVAFVAGTLYQSLLDLRDAAVLAGTVIGRAAELDELVLRGMEILGAMMRGLLEGGLGGTMFDFGKQMALQAAGQMKKDLVVELDFRNPLNPSNLSELMRYSFNMGTYIGQIVVDVLMTILGLEFIPLLIKGLKAVGGPLATLKDFVLMLLRHADDGLADELLAFAARAAGAADARVARFLEDMTRRAGYDSAEMEKGFEFLKAALKEDGYNKYVGTLFCSLPVPG